MAKTIALIVPKFIADAGKEEITRYTINTTKLLLNKDVIKSTTLTEDVDGHIYSLEEELGEFIPTLLITPDESIYSKEQIEKEGSIWKRYFCGEKLWEKKVLSILKEYKGCFVTYCKI